MFEGVFESEVGFLDGLQNSDCGEVDYSSGIVDKFVNVDNLAAKKII